MRFYWINDRISQGQFNIYWSPGPENLEDYHSKHHPPIHHRNICPLFLHVNKSSSLLGSVNLTLGVVPPKRIRQQANLKRYFLECFKPVIVNRLGNSYKSRQTWQSPYRLNQYSQPSINESSLHSFKLNVFTCLLMPEI